jgi:hypothetical protein
MDSVPDFVVFLRDFPHFELLFRKQLLRRSQLVLGCEEICATRLSVLRGTQKSRRGVTCRWGGCIHLEVLIRQGPTVRPRKPTDHWIALRNMPLSPSFLVWLKC